MSNGQQIISQEDTWDDGPQGRKAVKVSNKKGLPPGEYHLVLGIGGRVRIEGKVMVGNPVDESDSEVSGRIVDVRSQQPVAGATIMVLRPDAPLRDFLRTHDQSALFTSAETDSAGRFKLPKQLPKGQAYSLVAAARGYQPTSHRSWFAGIGGGTRAGGHRRSRIAARVLTLFHWKKRQAPSGKVHKTMADYEWRQPEQPTAQRGGIPWIVAAPGVCCPDDVFEQSRQQPQPQQPGRPPARGPVEPTQAQRPAAVASRRGPTRR